MSVVLPTREERAWAAGFFDGEGHTAKGSHKAYKSHNRRYNSCPSMAIAQIEAGWDNLVLFNRVTQVGKINGPYPQQLGRPQYQWQVGGFEKVQFVLSLLWPWLHTDKRRQARKALVLCRDNWKPRHG